MAPFRSAIGTAITRRAALFGIAATAAAAASPAFASAPAIQRNLGAFRSMHVVNPRTEESLNTVYWIDGEYIPEALNAIDVIMRDWREDLVHRIDPRTIDILSAAHRLLGCSEPFHIVSGYRSPKTNRLLRRQSGGVARNSFHLKGMAADIQLATRSVDQICSAALSLHAGGVGRYTRSEFVHVDSGPVRDWGR